jgi:hypothetical protein
MFKVPYPLPHIDQIINSTMGCETMSFLDAYSGYHQIRTKESDQLRNFLHHSVCHVLLHYHALRYEE